MPPRGMRLFCGHRDRVSATFECCVHCARPGVHKQAWASCKASERTGNLTEAGGGSSRDEYGGIRPLGHPAGDARSPRLSARSPPQPLMILIGDALEMLRTLPGESVQCVVTSPPYWGLRDYGVEGQIGLESTPEQYVARIVEVFREVKRVLRDDGTLWLNLGDSYARTPEKGGSGPNGKHDFIPSYGNARKIIAESARSGSSDGMVGRANRPGSRNTGNGLKPKDLVGIPWLVAFALRADGWYLRSDIIWCLSGGAQVYARTQKGDMPMSVKDLVRLDPATVKLWNGEKWTQALGWSESPGPRDGALEIELRSGERIGCTPGHKWPTQRGNVRTDELIPGDVIATTWLPEPESPIKADALDEDVAWFCGLYLAEGSMSGDTVQIAGHVNQSEHRLIRLRRMADRFHGTARVHTNGNTASICMDGPIVASIVRAYIHGDSAKNKGIKSRTWQRSNGWLLQLLMGYLAGDGHEDVANWRWRLGFTRNDRLADDLRTLAARVGASIRLSPSTVTGFGKEWPAYRGDIRLEPSTHWNARQNGEVVAVRPGRGRKFWDIGVEDEPHLFALASGVLTHNSKPNPMPESVTDRPTKSHEYVFLMSRNERYFFDADAVKEPNAWPDHNRFGNKNAAARRVKVLTGNMRPDASEHTDRIGRNIRTVWTIATQPTPMAHFATFPEALVERCIAAGSRPGDTVLDPFLGSGTVGEVAERMGRSWIGIELNPEYVRLAEKRTSQQGLFL